MDSHLYTLGPQGYPVYEKQQKKLIRKKQMLYIHVHKREKVLK